MILDTKPLTLAEVKTYLKDVDKEKPIHDYLKSFSELKIQDAEKLMNEVRALNSPKLKESHIVKLADFLPKDLEEVNKVCSDSNLSEEEASAILNITKNY